MKTLDKINNLKNQYSSRFIKYQRNLRKYYNCPNISLDNIRQSTAVGLMLDGNGFAATALAKPSINIIMSIIDTLTSKIATMKARPFFNTVDGTYADRQYVIQVQKYFDTYFDREYVSSKIVSAFKNACIFDTGYLFVEDGHILNLLPWQVYIDRAEQTYGKLTQIYYERTDYPVSMLPDNVKKKIVNKSITYCSYGIYIDLNEQKRYFIVNNRVIYDETIDLMRIPLVTLQYSKDIYGNNSASIVDILYTIQSQIDMIAEKISAAAELTPANTVFVPEGSSIKAGQLNNGVGNILTYKLSPNMTGSPVTIATPTFIDGQYSALLEEYINKAYELIGVSQLSATSKKPAGLDSGIALSTMENIESDRFQVQCDSVIHTYVELAKMCIEVNKGLILPEDKTRFEGTWEDVREAAWKFNIQYSAADLISKDPATKLQTIQQYIQMGAISQSQAIQLLEIPDLEAGYSLAGNATSAVHAIINDCLTKEDFDYEVPSYVPFTLLKEEIVNVQLSLKGANRVDNQPDIDKLQKLYDKATELEQTVIQASQPSQPSQPSQQTEGSIDTSGLSNMPATDLDMNSSSDKNGAWSGTYDRNPENF